jgi:uncharacterized small protein (DUF1192 family)
MGLDFKSDPTSDRADSLARENQALRAEVARLTAERAAIGSDHHDAISAIRLENYTLRAEVERLKADFRKHSEAAIELYSGIYALVESTCGIGLPVGCSPLRAVRMLADRVAELTRERDDALIALGRQTYTAPYRELVAWNNGDGPDPRDRTDSEWIAIGRLRLHAAGLAAAPADEGGVP